MAPTAGWKQKYAALDAAAITRRFVEDGIPGAVMARELGVKRLVIYRILKAAGVDNTRGWRFRQPDAPKTCPRCRRLLPVSAFAQIRRRERHRERSDRNEPRGYCADCYREYTFGTNLAKCGLTVAQFERLSRTQDDRCAICARAEVKGRRLAVDHDHATLVIRGLLCDGCNARVEVVEHRRVEAVDNVAHVEAYIATARTPYRWADRAHNARVDSS